MKPRCISGLIVGLALLWANSAHGQLYPHMILDPTQLDFTAVQGQSLPVSLSFTLTNSTGTGVLTWSVSDNADWLTENPTGGFGNFQTITVSVNTTALPAGDHAATIQVSSLEADNSPQSVSVDYHVLTSTCYGDANCDGEINVADAVYLINYIFRGGPPPGCW